MSNTAQSLAGKRIASLLDENSFVEIGGYVTARSTDFNMQQTQTPGDGVVTGYGLIDGHLVYVYSQDPAVLGGTIGEMHAKKIAGIYDMALNMGAPVIGLLDCAGLRLQEATDALNAFGSRRWRPASFRRSRQCSADAAAVWLLFPVLRISLLWRARRQSCL